MKIVLSTRNQSKAGQIKDLLRGLDVEVLTLDEAGVAGQAVEDGQTLEANALSKADFARRQTGEWALADDTGLFIDALGGLPGINAARWAGAGLSTEERMNFALKQMKEVPTGERSATFTTVAALISPQGDRQVFEGSVRGRILTEPRTSCQPDMPYSAIFVPDGDERTWAEMSVDEENAISHRGKAFRQVREFLESLFS